MGIKTLYKKSDGSKFFLSSSIGCYRQPFPWTTSKTVVKYVINISIKKHRKYFSIRLTIVLYLVVKKYTVYFDIIGVVGPRRFNLNFLELSLQEEFHVFNLFLNKECKIVQILENYLKTIPILLPLLAVTERKREPLSTMEDIL